jgi:hypothetical protein
LRAAKFFWISLSVGVSFFGWAGALFPVMMVFFGLWSLCRVIVVDCLHTFDPQSLQATS